MYKMMPNKLLGANTYDVSVYIPFPCSNCIILEY